MKSTDWGWRPVRPEGIWKHGCKWAKPLTVAAPWITLALLLVEFSLIEGRLVARPGLVFNLPATVSGDSATPGLAAIVGPETRQDGPGRETLGFFDDARYSRSEGDSVKALSERLAVRVQSDASGTLLLLTDARVSTGDMMRLAGIARDAGVVHVQIGERRE